MNSQKALLVIDMVNLYVYGEKPSLPKKERPKIISNIKKAISLAHKKKIPVIYINSAFRKSDPILEVIGYRSQAMAGSKDAQVIHELKPGPGDYVLEKRGYDGFWKSGLEKLFKKLKIKEIYLTGCQTDCCVRETGVTAAHFGYKVFILEDCCQTSREMGQKAAIRFMRTCVGEIINLKEL